MALHSASGPASDSCYKPCPMAPSHSAWAARPSSVVSHQSQPAWRTMEILVVLRMSVPFALETVFPGRRTVWSSCRLMLVAASSEQSENLSVEEHMY
jgi:hypothetical protein